jgi:hypothetical protein
MGEVETQTIEKTGGGAVCSEPSLAYIPYQTGIYPGITR